MSLLSPFLTALQLWLFNPRCSICGDRYPNLEAHNWLDHADDGSAA